MPLTTAEQGWLANLMDEVKAPQFPQANFLVVTFRDRDCRKHKAGFILDRKIDKPFKCDCSYVAAYSASEAERVSDQAKAQAAEYAFNQRLDEITVGVETAIQIVKNEGDEDDSAVSTDIVQDYLDGNARSYEPVEVAKGWVVGVETDDPVMKRGLFTLKVATTGERDLYTETRPEAKLSREADAPDAGYGALKEGAVSQMLRLPGASYITFTPAIPYTDTEGEGYIPAKFECKYCKHTLLSTDEQFVSTWYISERLFLAAIMCHYYECKRIASFKRVAQYKVDAQAWAFSTYAENITYA